VEQIKLAIEKTKSGKRPKAGRAVRKHVTPAAAERRVVMEQKRVPIYEPNPAMLEANRLVSFLEPDKGFAGFDMLRTRILHMMKTQNWRSIAVTSPGAGAGKTFVSLNLAGCIARLEAETPLLVDLDLRKPSIARYLGMQVKYSLIDHLTGDTSLYKTIVKLRSPELEILSNLKPVQNPGEVIASSKVQDLIMELHKSKRYSTLVFDLPPVLSTDDVIAFLPNVDCVLLVVSAGNTTSEEVEECLQLLDSFNIIGVVLNKCEVEGSEHYYY
jgi:protein-tyrosine kinase